MNLIQQLRPSVYGSSNLGRGSFERDPMLYAPLAIFDSGPDDVAYENGKADFE
jgi:hypothetical protein